MTAGTPLTAEPPEDMVLLRIMALMTIAMTATSDFGIGFMVADRTWTPIGTTRITPDLDKRFLWWREVGTSGAADMYAPQYFKAGGGTGAVPNSIPVDRDPTWFDISPKVRIEDGKHLLAVTYNSGAGSTGCVVQELRILMQRAGRR